MGRESKKTGKRGSHGDQINEADCDLMKMRQKSQQLLWGTIFILS